MKTINQIKESNRIIVGLVGLDGGQGEIHMPTWKGSVIWSNGGGWEHVSVSPYQKRITPSWDDMCKIKDIFFTEDECVVQYHPPKSQYVNNMTNCLHLWRPMDVAMPMPPSIMVGIRNGQDMKSAKEEAFKLGGKITEAQEKMYERYVLGKWGE